MKNFSRIAVAIAITASAACAPANRSSSWSHSAIRMQSAQLLPMPDLWALFPRLASQPPRASRLADGTRVGGDRSVGAEGLLGHTVNEVVPIPGTDMIRVGFLQEGTFSSNQFRSGAQEAQGRPGAVLIFKIARP